MNSCEVRQELLRRYSDAAEKLVPLSKEIANVALSYEAAMFMRIWERFTQAQELCEHSRRALESHTASHGCLNI
jgi:exonuclease VII large subunit